MLEQGCAALLQGHEVAGFVVRNAVEPAAVRDTDPLEGEGAQGGLMAGPASTVRSVEGFGAQCSQGCETTVPQPRCPSCPSTASGGAPARSLRNATTSR